jgi:hypothetical protein
MPQASLKAFKSVRLEIAHPLTEADVEYLLKSFQPWQPRLSRPGCAGQLPTLTVLLADGSNERGLRLVIEELAPTYEFGQPHVQPLSHVAARLQAHSDAAVEQTKWKRPRPGDMVLPWHSQFR